MTRPVKIHRAFFVSGKVAIPLPMLRDSIGVSSFKITDDEKKAIESLSRIKKSKAKKKGSN